MRSFLRVWEVLGVWKFGSGRVVECSQSFTLIPAPYEHISFLFIFIIWFWLTDVYGPTNGTWRLVEYYPGTMKSLSHKIKKVENY